MEDIWVNIDKHASGNDEFLMIIVTSYFNQPLCLSLGICFGDSGASVWKKETIEGDAEEVSTVLGVVSYFQGSNCGEISIAHKVAHKDILKWISQNWKK